MKTNVWYLVSALTIILICSACERTQVREGPAPGVRVDDPKAPYARIRMNTVNIIDKSLQQWHGSEGGKRSKIAVEDTKYSRTPTGTWKVWAVLRNRTNYPLQIEGRIQFFDQYESPLEGPTPWKRIFLPENGVGTYAEFSTTTLDGVYYYIELREGR